MVLRLIVCFILLISLQSCIGAGHSLYNRGVSQDVSVEQIDDPVLDAFWFDLSEKKLVPLARKGTSRFMFDGITVHVRPHNDQPTVTFIGVVVPIIPIPVKAISSATGISYKLESPFMISLSIDSAGIPFSFDTRKPVIKIDNGKEVAVKEALSFSCNDPEKYGPLKDPIMMSSKKICVHLLFDIVPPEPTSTFTFTLEGITKNERPLKGPQIKFIEASSWGVGGTSQ